MPSLRAFIAELDRHGLLMRVQKEVDWKYEIGRISRENALPILFENIKDYPDKSLFVNGLANYPAFAVALGIHDRKIGYNALVAHLRRSFSMPIPPVLAEGPLRWENRMTGALDLSILPVPWWSEFDANRYLGTWHLNISCDPETGQRNIGVYRMQILGPSTATISISNRSDVARQVGKAEKSGKVLPMAIAIGVDERLVIGAAAAPSYGTDEYSLAGGLFGRPIEIIRCETQPLEVPADSEVVIEGYIRPDIRVKDGPFLDYAGVPNTNPRAFLFQATALFFRHNLIFRGTAVGRAGAEDHQLYSILAGAHVADFHGSRLRHFLQTFLLRHRAFRLFQLTGKFGHLSRARLIPLNSRKR